VSIATLCSLASCSAVFSVADLESHSKLIVYFDIMGDYDFLCRIKEELMASFIQNRIPLKPL